MRRAAFLAAAQADLVDTLIRVTEGSGSLATGRQLMADLRARCHKLAALPGVLGRPRPELRPDIRSYPYRNHIIYFRCVGRTFEVGNILHARRDLADRFAPPEEP